MAYQPKSYRKFLAGTVSAAVVASAIAPVASAASFTDVAGSVHADDIATLVAKGYIKGYADGTFKPNKPLTRGEAAIIFSRILKDAGVKAPEQGAGFPDVPASKAELAEAVAIVKAAGVMGGDEKGNFNPNANITREQMAKVVVEAFKLTKPANHTTKITDLDKAGSWAREYIQTLEANGVTKNTEFAPKQNVTRGQFASFVVRAMAVKGEVTPAVEKVEVLSKTKLVVTFNTAVDAVKAENFAIEGATVVSATLSADKKQATLEVSNLEYGKDYTVVVKDVLVNGKTVGFGTKSFKTPAISELWGVRVTTKDASLVANGADNTVVTFELVSKGTNEVDAKADNIVLDLNITYGTLSQKRVTIQNGKATVILTSEFSAKEVIAKIDAQIIEASGDYKDLIGKVSGSGVIAFKPAASGVVETITLVGGESNQADRVTLFFDKTPTEQQLKESQFVVKQGSKEVIPLGFKLVKDNPKAVELILKRGEYLTDNKEVTVIANVPNAIGKPSTSSTTFVLTDARPAEVTSVQVEGLNTIKVVFSEAVDSAHFVIDGRFVEGKGFKVNYGDFDPITRKDERHIVTIELDDNFKENDKAKVGYFTPGQHSLQVSSVKDFAALTDPKNIGTTQNLTFNVIEDTTKPTAEVKVESPEQFRITFDKVLKEEDLLNKFQLEFYNEDTKKYEKVTSTVKNGRFAGWSDDPSDVSSVLSVKRDSNKPSSYVVELKKDWTEIYDTANTKLNYYNDKFRIVIAEGAVTNKANGEKNAEIVLDLNYAGSPLNQPDTESPKILDIIQSETNKTTFTVKMSEPVKLVGKNGVVLDDSDTIAQGQGALPKTLVDFIGKDEKGKLVTISGEVVNYADSSDMSFNVNASLQDLVNKGYDENWTVVVKSISDDVGNTASSLTKEFKVPRTSVSQVFKVKEVKGDLADSSKDVVKITFTSGVQYRGGVYDATNPAQYALNGKNLPVGTKIEVQDIDNNVENGYEMVVITLPDSTLLEKSNTITVNRNLQSAQGSVLQGGYEFVFSVVNATLESAKATYKDGSQLGTVEAQIKDGKEVSVDVSSLADSVSFTGVEIKAKDATKLAFSIPGVQGTKEVNFTDGVAVISPSLIGASGGDVALETLRGLGDSIKLDGTLYDKAGNTTAVTITIKLK
ncbi:S-layer homology domain-containing protein [Anoxybacillus suryakundensis]|uniref:S-layer homology domain n=1 Tax=Anoxybacillus suryakundensis TaxID=1325335 RepID=A0A0K6GPV2_9BACL|nr:S-layer homology domain-containing protein [Anoxybacillus suryakundensis]CUA80780.1 S-layer homology domain [Anoxybacillus suryakundensis]